MTPGGSRAVGPCPRPPWPPRQGQVRARLPLPRPGDRALDISSNISSNVTPELAARGGDGRELRAVQAGGVAALHQARPPRLPQQLPHRGRTAVQSCSVGVDLFTSNFISLQGNMELLPQFYP